MGWLWSKEAKVAPVTQGVMVEALPETKRISKGKKFFSVSVRVTAPSASDSTAIDLVAVVDTSASMSTEMLENVKNSLVAIVNKLGEKDRFSVVSFGSQLRCCTPLREMTEINKVTARSELHNLVARRGSDKVTGFTALEQATKILKERKTNLQHDCFIVLILAGENDPACKKAISNDFPVYTIGLGKNYEAESQVMYPLSENSRGKDLEKLIRQFKPVGARNTKIKLDTPDGVTIRSIKSGSHRGDVIEGQPRVIEIKRMYAGEVKMFTVSLRRSPRDDNDETRRSFLETFSSRAAEIKLMTLGSSTDDSPVESSTDVFVVETAQVADIRYADNMEPEPEPEMELCLLKHNILDHIGHAGRFWRTSSIVRVLYLVVLWILLLQVVDNCYRVFLFFLFLFSLLAVSIHNVSD